MSTPEYVIKNIVTDYFMSIGMVPASKASTATKDHTGWFFKPVSNGMGVHGIPDFICHYKGYFFVVETKPDDTKIPTVRQKQQLNAISATKAKSFVVGSYKSLELVKAWIHAIDTAEC